MSLIGNQPVMWVNVKSLLTSGPYAESQMQLWNSALIQACARYPGMRVYDWAADAQSSWFIADGIHYTSAGYAARAHLIAQALAAAFPASGHRAPHRPGCLVS
jgi:lysophospholipase L1-like esterase